MTATATPLPATDSIGTSQLQRLLAHELDVRILDVRSGGEFETVHIPGSFNVPLDTLGEHVADLADTSRPVVLVCRSGGRATQAHQKLASAGRDALHILEGGMDAWEAAGGEVIRGSTERWAMDRQVRLVAGGVGLLGLLLSVVVPKAKWITAAITGGLFYSAVSNTCAMATVLSKLPYNQTDRCDIGAVLAELDPSGPTQDR